MSFLSVFLFSSQPSLQPLPQQPVYCFPVHIPAVRRAGAACRRDVVGPLPFIVRDWTEPRRQRASMILQQDCRSVTAGCRHAVPCQSLTHSTILPATAPTLSTPTASTLPTTLSRHRPRLSSPSALAQAGHRRASFPTARHSAQR